MFRFSKSETIIAYYLFQYCFIGLLSKLYVRITDENAGTSRSGEGAGEHSAKFGTHGLMRAVRQYYCTVSSNT